MEQPRTLVSPALVRTSVIRSAHGLLLGLIVLGGRGGGWSGRPSLRSIGRFQSPAASGAISVDSLIDEARRHPDEIRQSIARHFALTAGSADSQIRGNHLAVAAQLAAAFNAAW